jgi:predicted CXXCH cytochrome family protein
MLLVALSIPSTWARTPVSESVHNLSASGPGELKSLAEVRICVFCHTPHRAAKGVGLWNRRVGEPASSYQSSTLDAETSPQRGSTSLCLSCHDGTIALGEMLKPPRGASTIELGGIYIRGRGAFGSNLSNHHPVRITYDSNLAARDDTLVSPSLVELPLWQGEMHCATCHDPHSPEYPPFLNKPSLDGELCTTCHAFAGADWDWSRSSHAQSDTIPGGRDPWPERKPEWRGRTVGENACENCHASHNAVTPERLIKDVEEQTCYRCHDGTVAEMNIQAEAQKFYRHPVDRIGRGVHDVGQRDSSIGSSFHVECEDCHNPHAASNDLPMVSFFP